MNTSPFSIKMADNFQDVTHWDIYIFLNSSLFVICMCLHGTMFTLLQVLQVQRITSVFTSTVFTLLQMPVTYSALGEECFFYSVIKRDVLFCI